MEIARNSTPVETRARTVSPSAGILTPSALAMYAPRGQCPGVSGGIPPAARPL